MMKRLFYLLAHRQLKTLVLGLMFIFSYAPFYGQLSNEVSFSLGAVFVPHSTTDPLAYGATFAAANGSGLQLDYKLLNKSVGIQLSISYLINPYDDAYATDVVHASSVNADSWYSLIGMIKFVGRGKILKQKLLMDFSFGVGTAYSTFSNQIFTYDSDYEPPNGFTIDQMYSPEKTASGIVFSPGIRVHYAFESFSLFLNYDYIFVSQNYSVNYLDVSSGGIDLVTERIAIKRNYSTLFIGLAFPF
jgi:hypothetical protein